MNRLRSLSGIRGMFVRSVRRSLILLGCIAVLSGAAGCREPGEVGETDFNLVLISIDTLRADRMSLYGYHRPTTPFMNEWADETVVFDRFFYSGGGTLPSHLSMLTSLHPRTHWVHPGNDRVLEAERVTLAEQLKEVGFQTAGFTDSGWMRGKFGFSQGFDFFDDEGGRFKTILPKAYSWLEQHHEQRFFLFLHTYDVHSEHSTDLPYSCPDGLELLFARDIDVDFSGCRDGRCATALLAWANKEIKTAGVDSGELFSGQEIEFISALYDGCISYADQKIGEVVAHLKDLGVYDETMIIVTSDHGEEFAEHGMFLHDQGGYEELAHLPLIIKFPKGDHAGSRVSEMAAIVDIMPTVLETFAIPGNDQIQGFSLIPAINGHGAVRQDLHMYSVLRTERWKYFSDQRELYDLASDPLEKTNIYESNPELVGELEARVRGLARVDIDAYEAFRASIVDREAADEKADLTEEEIERLKALGYLQ